MTRGHARLGHERRGDHAKCRSKGPPAHRWRILWPGGPKRDREGLRCSLAAIAGNFGNDVVDAEKARVRLAEALLSIADEDSRDVEVLKRAALQRMALDYKRRR